MLRIFILLIPIQFQDYKVSPIWMGLTQLCQYCTFLFAVDIHCDRINRTMIRITNRRILILNTGAFP
jgi:hypothetical protein